LQPRCPSFARDCRSLVGKKKGVPAEERATSIIETIRDRGERR